MRHQGQESRFGQYVNGVKITSEQVLGTATR